MDDLQHKVFTVIAETLHIPHERIQLEKRIEDLADDSIQLFELILAFEQAFSTQVRYEDLISIETVEDIIHFVISHPEHEQQFRDTAGPGK